MNDNAPESERWVPVPAKGDEVVLLPPSEQFAKNAIRSPALDRARREAEAVIADRFKRIS